MKPIVKTQQAHHRGTFAHLHPSTRGGTKVRKTDQNPTTKEGVQKKGTPRPKGGTKSLLTPALPSPTHFGREHHKTKRKSNPNPVKKKGIRLEKTKVRFLRTKPASGSTRGGWGVSVCWTPMGKADSKREPGRSEKDKKEERNQPGGRTGNSFQNQPRTHFT